MNRCLIALLALAVSACASASGEYAKGSGKTLAIGKETWSYYESYLQVVGNTRPGAFVVTVDGTGAAWTWCEQLRCRTDTGYANDALADCRRAYGMDCVVFARSRDIQVNYEIVD
jgi:hypothetical protein